MKNTRGKRVSRAFIETATVIQPDSVKKKKQKDPQPDYCLTCRVPVSKCKGDCNAKQRKQNGG